MKNLTHLHVHTSYSFLDGECKPHELIARAKELGMTAIAITDHNHMGGTYAFQKECKAQGLKPILGLEAYYTEDRHILSKPSEERNFMAAQKALASNAITESEYEVLTNKEAKKNSKLKISDLREKIKPYQYDTKQYHIIFLAMNQTGWNNLIKLQSEAAVDCTFNGRFLCDNELIKKYNEGIICTTACIANRIARYVNNNQLEEAEDLLTIWHSIFQDRFYLEIQPLAVDDQTRVNAFYIKMSEKYNIPLVATNDVHYIYKEDHDDHDTLLCIGTGKKKKDVDRLRYSNDYWLRTREEMVQAFKFQYHNSYDILPDNYFEYVEKALDNTNIIASRIDSNIKIGSSTPMIPQVKLEDGENANDYFSKQCYKGLYELAKKDKFVSDHIDIYERRLVTELNVIIPKGFASYFLVVDEYTKWSRDNDIFVGPGRGSAAGSLALYLLGVTKVIDPIKSNLLFERFLNPDRTALPDVDLDFDYYGRDRVIKHLEDYYKPECVAHIGTYTVMGVKSGLKDVGRVLEIPFDVMNNISKQLDEILDKPQPKFKDFDDLQEDNKIAWDKFHKLEEENQELFRIARKFEGLVRNFGVHASGMLAMPIPITDMTPLRVADGVRVSLYTGPELEELNLIKLDILGLKTLTMIKEALKDIDEALDYDTFLNKIDLNDPNIFKMLRAKKTDAVFQLESDMFKGMIQDIQPDQFNDVVAITSLGRPGPLSAGMPQAYAKRKNGEEEATPLLRGMEMVLDETYGEIVYQEQIMNIGVYALGFSMGQADSLIRKIFAKKKRDKMEMLRRMMIYGKINSKGPEGWHDNPNLPWYDEKEEYGAEIKGGTNNGYSKQEMLDFWEKIQGFCEYLFNKSHAASYSAISLQTAYLKYYYPVEFFAAVLSAQETDEKIAKYVTVARNEGIKIVTPDINHSKKFFTPDAKKKEIYYGLGSIKGVGEAAVNAIIENQPYNSIQDLFDKLPKKVLNKRVLVALVKSGALDSFNSNRYDLMNQCMEIRKEKNWEALNPEEYDEQKCIEFEEEIISAAITYTPWWTQIKPNSKIDETALIISKTEKMDKKGGLMAFLILGINHCKVEAIIFSSVYKKHIGLFDEVINPSKIINVVGTKDDKNKLIIKDVYEYREA